MYVDWLKLTVMSNKNDYTKYHDNYGMHQTVQWYSYNVVCTKNMTNTTIMKLFMQKKAYSIGPPNTLLIQYIIAVYGNYCVGIEALQ